MAKGESSLRILSDAIKYLALCRLVFQKLDLGLSVWYLCRIDAVGQLLLGRPALSLSLHLHGRRGALGEGEGDKEFVSGREKHCFLNSRNIGKRLGVERPRQTC